MKEIILDTETTGLSVKEGHRIVEIGCIELDNLVPTKNKFHCYLNPQRKVSERALEVHGYTDEFLSTQKKFIDIVDDFLNFIENKRLVIHNAQFDLSHLNNELALLGKKKINSENVIDTLVLARDKFPGSPTSLDALCKRYRIDNSKRTQHTALIDCDLLSKVYINLLDQKEPTLNFYVQDNIKLQNDLDKVIEINTILKFVDKEENQKKSHFEITYTSIVKIDEKVTEKKDMEKLILCDVPNKIYPELEKIFLNLISDSGFPGIKFEKKIDFTKLYKEKNN